MAAVQKRSCLENTQALPFSLNDWNALQYMKELWLLYMREHKGINSTFFKKVICRVINMYDTIDPSPGDFWGLLAGTKQQTHPSQVVVAASGVLMWIECCWASPKGPHCSQAVSSRVNPSVAQVKTKQCNQGEVFKMSLQSMFGNQVQSWYHWGIWCSTQWCTKNSMTQAKPRGNIYEIYYKEKRRVKWKKHNIHKEIQQLK